MLEDLKEGPQYEAPLTFYAVAFLFSKSVKSSCARELTFSGTPASLATAIPWLCEAGPGRMVWRNFNLL